MNFSQLGFGFFSLKIYGLLVVAAFIISSWRYYRQLSARGFPIDFFAHHFWRWVLGGLVVGRLFAIALDPEIIARHGMFSLFAVWDGEVHFFGTMLGGLAMAAWDLRAHQFKFWRWLDAGMSSILIGVLIADLAGFLTGAVYGTETVMPWGVQYETFGVDILSPVHPVTLYAFVVHLWLLRWVAKSFSVFERTPGRLSKLAILYFFAAVFILQFFRGDATLMVFDLFRIEQIFALATVAACAWGLRFSKRN